MDIFFDDVFCKTYSNNPLTLVDVGACGGLQPQWKRAKKFLRVLGFEPDARAFSDLMGMANDGSVRYFNIGLHKEKSTLDIHVTRKCGNSSLFKPNTRFLQQFPEVARFDVLQKAKISVDSMDNQFSHHGVKDIDFIKVDTQGSELYILQGARETLRRDTFGVEIEVEFAEIYEGQPLFSDVDRFLSPLGFELINLRPQYWKRAEGVQCRQVRGQIIYADALYFRSPDSFQELLKNLPNDMARKGKVLRALTICVLYGYRDYALEILKSSSSCFSSSELELLNHKIKGRRSLASYLPNFRGRGLISRFFYQLWKFFQPFHQGWAASGEVLENTEL